MINLSDLSWSFSSPTTDLSSDCSDNDQTCHCLNDPRPWVVRPLSLPSSTCLKRQREFHEGGAPSVTSTSGPGQRKLHHQERVLETGHVCAADLLCAAHFTPVAPNSLSVQLIRWSWDNTCPNRAPAGESSIRWAWWSVREKSVLTAIRIILIGWRRRGPSSSPAAITIPTEMSALRKQKAIT